MVSMVVAGEDDDEPVDAKGPDAAAVFRVGIGEEDVDDGVDDLVLLD